MSKTDREQLYEQHAQNGRYRRCFTFQHLQSLGVNGSLARLNVAKASTSLIFSATWCENALIIVKNASDTGFVVAFVLV